MNNNIKTNNIRLRQQVRLIPGYILLILWCLFIVVMLGWIVIASLSTTKEIFSDNLLRSGLHWDNYTHVIKNGHLVTAFLNSLLYSASSVFFSILICAPAAYGLARFKFKYSEAIKRLLVIGLGVPGVMIIMPLFSLVSALNVSNSKITLIVIYVVTSIPFSTFYLLPAFTDISDSYEEAAAIDGCGPLRTFWTIVFPLAGNSITTLVIFQFIGKWNEYFMALIFAGSTENMSLSVALYQLIVAMTREGGWSGMFAAVTFVSAPTIIIYILLSKRLIGGATAGGLKG